MLLRCKNIVKVLKKLCNFATSTFQILSNGLRKVWCVGEKRIVIGVPKMQ